MQPRGGASVIVDKKMPPLDSSLSRRTSRGLQTAKVLLLVWLEVGLSQYESGEFAILRTEKTDSRNQRGG